MQVVRIFSKKYPDSSKAIIWALDAKGETLFSHTVAANTHAPVTASRIRAGTNEIVSLLETDGFKHNIYIDVWTKG